MVLAGTSLAVAAIPEGLPAIATVSLAAGAQRMAKRGVIVRSIGAAETLGGVNLICTDKTGTLTKNQMTVRSLYTHTWWHFAGEGYEPAGEIYSPQGEKGDEDLELALKIMALCNEAQLIQDKGSWKILGDPTEGALLVAAAKGGIWQREVQRSHPLRFLIPFESQRRYMVAVCLDPKGGPDWVLVKGAPEAVLESCSFYRERRRELPLSPEKREFYLKKAEEMSDRALRVLALAYKRENRPGKNEDLLTRALVLVGLVGMQDPPRPEAPRVLEKCRRAGIEVRMITGDHPHTARAIALEVGLIRPGDKILTGKELERLPEEQWKGHIQDVKVFAQVLPHHKYELINLFKEMGYVVAMTGDGINDAPAVKAAHVGIAMGKSGTHVTREAASLIIY